MRLKACSLFLGYKEYKAAIVKDGKGGYSLGVESIGEIAPADYVRHGFRVLEAKSSELQGLVAGGYENKRVLMRFYDTKKPLRTF